MSSANGLLRPCQWKTKEALGGPARKQDHMIKFDRRLALRGSVSMFAILATAQLAQAQDATPIPDVSVNAPATPLMDGSAAAGYRVKDTTASGPIWGDLPIQDAPYSITVVPSALIENTQSNQPEDIYKIIPQITNYHNDINSIGYAPAPLVRGFNVGFSMDGLSQIGTNVYGSQANALEDKESVQLLSGVNGFLYGNSTNLGGNLDLTLKRPTAAPYYSLTFGDNAGRNEYIHGDFGGPLAIPGLDPGILGYRLNLVGQDGHTSVENQTVKRGLASGAFDIHLPWDILVQLNASHNYYQTDGLTRFATTNLNPWPAPSDPSKSSNPNWTQAINMDDIGGVKVTWKPNEIFTIRSEYQYDRGRYAYPAETQSSVLNYNGTMSVSSTGSHGFYQYTHSGYAFLDADFSTFGIKHKVTTGFSGNNVSLLIPQSFTRAAYYNYGTTNYYDSGAAGYPYPGDQYRINAFLPYVYSQTFQKNYFLGDRILAFDDRLIVLAGGNYTSVGSNSFSNTGTTPGYQFAAITPTVSVTYKVLPWLSTYASYQQAVQNARTVTNTATTRYTNVGTVLPPYLGIQYEAGVKTTVGTNLLLTAAYFHIVEEHQYDIANVDGTFTATESGNETHQGVEVTATGKLTDELTLFGGFTVMDPRIEGAISTPWQNGQLPAGVSPISAKLYAEYTLPFMAGMPEWLHHLTLIGGIYYTGPFNGSTPGCYAVGPGCTFNSSIAGILKLPSYTTGDLGFRYDTKLYEHPFILRFNVTNITNHGYYDQAGALVEGLPRTFMATAEVKW